MLGPDPWYQYRTLRRAAIVGVSAFSLAGALLVLKQVTMSLRAVQILVVGWFVFVLIMQTLTYHLRCPRCGQRFHVKGTFKQMATKCLHCGQNKYEDVIATTNSGKIGQ